MKTILAYLSLIALLTIPLSINAQVELRFEFGCNFNTDKVKGEYTLFEPTTKAGQVVDEILKKVAINDRPFVLQAANVANAQASIRGKNSRYLLYSNEFMKQFTSDARTKWAAYTVFAHEIGHHVLLHDLEDTSATNRRKFELQADAWAARLLARMGASREDALAAVNALPDDNSRFYPKKSARVEQMGIAYDEEKASLDKTTQVAISANKTAIAIDPKSFNRWSIIKKENVKATIDDDKVVIELNNISDFYRERKLSIKITSNDGNMRVTKVDGTGENLDYSMGKKIVWHFTEDEATKITASGAEKLRISVYSMNNKPQTVGGTGLALGVAAVGVGSFVYSFIARSSALADYKIYRLKTDENDPAYTKGNREAFYTKANSQYKQSQVFMGVGGVLAALGGAWWYQKTTTNKKAKEAGFGYLPEKKRWWIEPLVGDNGGIGLRIRF